MNDRPEWPAWVPAEKRREFARFARRVRRLRAAGDREPVRVTIETTEAGRPTLHATVIIDADGRITVLG